MMGLRKIAGRYAGKGLQYICNFVEAFVFLPLFLSISAPISISSTFTLTVSFQFQGVTMSKKFKLLKEQIKPLVGSLGSCIATDMITVDGLPVRFMYREEPSDDIDSGWRFMSGREDDDYIDNPDNLEIYEVNTIANYDPTIIPLLLSPIGSVFEKTLDSNAFSAVTDWIHDEE
jgi:hypothetical protein